MPMLRIRDNGVLAAIIFVSRLNKANRGVVIDTWLNKVRKYGVMGGGLQVFSELVC